MIPVNPPTVVAWANWMCCTSCMERAGAARIGSGMDLCEKKPQNVVPFRRHIYGVILMSLKGYWTSWRLRNQALKSIWLPETFSTTPAREFWFSKGHTENGRWGAAEYCGGCQIPPLCQLPGGGLSGLVTDTLLAVETVPRDGLLDLPRATADANNPGALEGTGGRGGATCPDPVKSWPGLTRW